MNAARHVASPTCRLKYRLPHLLLHHRLVKMIAPLDSRLFVEIASGRWKCPLPSPFGIRLGIFSGQCIRQLDSSESIAQISQTGGHWFEPSTAHQVSQQLTDAFKLSTLDYPATCIRLNKETKALDNRSVLKPYGPGSLLKAMRPLPSIK